MADVDLAVNDRVTIDGKGLGIIKSRIFRGFGTCYTVELFGSDFQVELPGERLTRVENSFSELSNAHPQPTEVVPNTEHSSRFRVVSDDQVDEFNSQQINRNTLTKTASDLRTLRAFLDLPDIKEPRDIHQIPVPELSSVLCRFLVSVKKKNGDEYEPSCLRGMISSFDRQLRRKNYEQSIANGPGFAKVRETLSMKQRQLKSVGKGNLPQKSEALSDDDIDKLWITGQLGSATPDSILQTLWLYNTVHFGLRSCQEHRDMCWGDIAIKKDDRGHDYLQFTERQTKTRSGENPRDVRAVAPKLWSNNTNIDRCPVKIYKMYAEKRPTGYSDPNHPFYIATTTVPFPSPRDSWFKRNPVGINKLASTLRRMVQKAGLNPSKKLSNHSARKYLIQKLNDNNIPANQIMQISGHRNIASINNYSHLNPAQHKQISNILYSNTNDRENLPPVSTQSYAAVRTESRSSSSSSLHVSGGFHNIFGAPIHGGNFHVHVYNTNEDQNPPKRRRIWNPIDSDSDA